MFATHGPRLPHDRYVRYLEERAAGGVGIIGLNAWPLGLMNVPLGSGTSDLERGTDLDGVPYHPLGAQGRAHHDAMIPMVAEWVAAAKRHGAVTIAQLFHPGSARHEDNFLPAVSSSCVANEYDRVWPQPLSDADIGVLVECYRDAARRAREAGADMIELHAAHGYLLQQFLSPLLNRRTDRWGGTLEARLRFPLAVLQAAREGAGIDVPVGIRLAGNEPDGGLDKSAIVTIARHFETRGAAYISVSGTSYSGLWRGAGDAYVPSALTEAGRYRAISRSVREAVSIPVMVSGSIASIDQADAVVVSGDADVVGMVRALIADPQLVKKGLGGDGARPRPCIAGNECHYGRPLVCAVNPRAGRERELAPAAAHAKRRILVIGGGPAGIECALTSDLRGHEVILIDKGDRPGGSLIALCEISRQARFGDYLDDALARLEGSGVDARFGTSADEEFVRSVAPDVVVLATGAEWEGKQASDPWSALAGVDAGQAVIVAGGLDDHLPPLVVADHLSRRGHRVLLLSECAAPGQAVEPASYFALMRCLTEREVEVWPFTALLSYDGNLLRVRNTLTSATHTVEISAALIEIDGRRAALPDGRYDGLAEKVVLIGDALSPRRMVHATLDGVRAGSSF